MKREVYILLPDLRSVHNVGSIFRTADARGVKKIYLSGTTPTALDRFGDKRKDFAKVALGAEDTVPWEKVDAIECIKNFKKQWEKEGGEVIAIEQNSSSVDFRKAKIGSKILFIFGNEVNGISPEILKYADKIMEIEQFGTKESLNVSVTAGIVLFHF